MSDSTIYHQSIADGDRSQLSVVAANTGGLNLGGFASNYLLQLQRRLIDASKLRVPEVLVRQNDSWKLILSHGDTMQILSRPRGTVATVPLAGREPLKSRLNAKQASQQTRSQPGFSCRFRSVQFDVEGVNLFDADIAYAQDRAVGRYPGPEPERA